MSDIYSKLTKPFGRDALSTDRSRGTALTSIKAQYVIERLNETVGPDGWETNYEFRETEFGVAAICKLTLKIDDRTVTKMAVGACPYVTKSKTRGDIPKLIGDVYKSAMTDSLGKAASHFGVGNDVFKGLVDPNTFQSKGSATTTEVKQSSSTKTTTARPSFKRPTKATAPTPEVEEGYGDDI